MLIHWGLKPVILLGKQTLVMGKMKKIWYDERKKPIKYKLYLKMQKNIFNRMFEFIFFVNKQVEDLKKL